jgi:hypothetical protein
VTLRLEDYGVDLHGLAVELQQHRPRRTGAEWLNDMLLDVRDWKHLDAGEIEQRFRAEPLAILSALELTQAADYLERHAISEPEFLRRFYEPRLLRRLVWLDLDTQPEEPPELPLSSLIAPPGPWGGLLFLQQVLRWAERFGDLQPYNPRALTALNLRSPFAVIASDGGGEGLSRLVRDLVASLGIAEHYLPPGHDAAGLQPWLLQQFGLEVPVPVDSQRRMTYSEAGGTPRSLFVVRAIGGVDGYEVRGLIGDDLGLIIDIGDREVTPAATAYMEGHVLRVINASTPLTAVIEDECNIRLRWHDTSLTAEDMGRLIYEALKREFTLRTISVNVIFDSMRISSLRPSILAYREDRNRQLAKRTEENSAFIACRACQCYAPHAMCVVSVDRPPCCGRSYDELSTLAQFTTHMEQFEVEPGVCQDRPRGSYMGLDKVARLLTDGNVQSLNLHSLREKPHPTTAIPQCIAYYLDELDLVCIVSRDFTGRTPDGKTFDTLLARTAGRQQPGFMGISEAYIQSPRFLAQEGGLSRVGWINSSLKQRLKLKIEHIATEHECTNMNALREFTAPGRVNGR